MVVSIFQPTQQQKNYQSTSNQTKKNIFQYFEFLTHPFNLTKGKENRKKIIPLKIKKN